MKYHCQLHLAWSISMWARTATASPWNWFIIVYTTTLELWQKIKWHTRYKLAFLAFRFYKIQFQPGSLQTWLGELTTISQTPIVSWGGDTPLPILTPINTFSTSLSMSMALRMIAFNTEYACTSTVQYFHIQLLATLTKQGQIESPCKISTSKVISFYVITWMQIYT